jgi:hypothetical protein
VGRIASGIDVSEAFLWLFWERPGGLDAGPLARRLSDWRTMTATQTGEISILLHAFASEGLLAEIASQAEMYSAPAPFESALQAELALLGLARRFAEPLEQPLGPGSEAALLAIFRALSKAERISPFCGFIVPPSGIPLLPATLPRDSVTRCELASLARAVAARLPPHPDRESAVEALNNWASALERTVDEQAAQETETPTPNLTGDSPHGP